MVVFGGEAHGLGAEYQPRCGGVGELERDVVGDDVLLEKAYGFERDLGWEENLESVVAAAQKSEGLQSPRPIQERGLLRDARRESLDVRRQLAVEKSLGMPASRDDQRPPREWRLQGPANQDFRR